MIVKVWVKKICICSKSVIGVAHFFFFLTSKALISSSRLGIGGSGTSIGDFRPSSSGLSPRCTTTLGRRSSFTCAGDLLRLRESALRRGRPREWLRDRCARRLGERRLELRPDDLFRFGDRDRFRVGVSGLLRDELKKNRQCNLPTWMLELKTYLREEALPDRCLLVRDSLSDVP